jgi:hypothetical protein
VKASRILKAIAVGALAGAGILIIHPFVPAFAGESKGIIFGRINDKVSGNSWGGEGKLIVVVGTNEKNKKTFKMCPNGYVAAEVENGKVKLDVVKLPKGGSDGFVDRTEAYLNQPTLTVKPGGATYWGDVKVNYDYGSLIFKPTDKAEATKTATVACLKEMGDTALADKLAKATVDKQLVFIDMNKR